MLLTAEEESRIIEMAWEDRTPFEAIEEQFSMNESEVIKFMRSSLKIWVARIFRFSTTDKIVGTH